jgi:uncharacterized membrane protein YeaQ/YmgE (transglycosylase-associated protein family)
MALVWMLMVGLVIGGFARLLVPGRHPGGLMMSLLLGVAGSCVAGYIGRGMGFYDVPGQGSGLVASLVGAVLMLFVYRAVRNQR